uniref:Proline rich and Gla domain 4 n=1 Tax=Propithecus coquereli TaxID=379532 RepID=A0A2K6FBN2_PROCO
MFTLLVLLSQLPVVTFAFPHCTRTPKESKHAGEEVFTSKEEANFFIHRRLLYNRFDLELFTPGDVERECNEELCNYEEAREIFVDEDKTIAFWQKYSIKGPTTKSSSAVYVRRGRHTPSIIFRRPEEAVLSPSSPSVEDTGLPSYEQAVALTRKHNVSPPPPYPGPAKGFRVFKKSMSLPSH